MMANVRRRSIVLAMTADVVMTDIESRLEVTDRASAVTQRYQSRPSLSHVWPDRHAGAAPIPMSHTVGVQVECRSSAGRVQVECATRVHMAACA